MMSVEKADGNLSWLKSESRLPGTEVMGVHNTDYKAELNRKTMWLESLLVPQLVNPVRITVLRQESRVPG